MNYQDDVKVGEMIEGQKYAIYQGYQYCDGVWVTKQGDELILQHFWENHVLEDNKDGFYYYDEKDGVCYPKEDPTSLVKIHKDIMQVVESAIEYDFNDISLRFFYDEVFMGYIYYELETGEKKLPLHLKHTIKYYNEKGEEVPMLSA